MATYFSTTVLYLQHFIEVSTLSKRLNFVLVQLRLQSVVDTNELMYAVKYW